VRSAQGNKLPRVLRGCALGIQFPGVFFFLCGVALSVCLLTMEERPVLKEYSRAAMGAGAALMTLWGAAAIVLGHYVRRGSLRAAV